LDWKIRDSPVITGVDPGSPSAMQLPKPPPPGISLIVTSVSGIQTKNLPASRFDVVMVQRPLTMHVSAVPRPLAG
jgi:hypothetical protein